MKTYSDLPADGGSGILEQVGAQHAAVAKALAGVERVVAVASGKGGVGKSTVSVSLAATLAARGDAVALLDADLNGPSLPALCGVRARPRLGPRGLEPPEAAGGIALVSTALFLAERDEPLRHPGPETDAWTWRSTAEATTLRELMSGTDWGRRAWLVVDLPPGAERLEVALAWLPRLDGVIVVTTASALALEVVGRSVTAARDAGAPVLGLVENMAGLACGECGARRPLFGTERSTAEAAERLETSLLARLPFDPALAAAAESESLPQAVLDERRDAATGRELERLRENLEKVVRPAERATPTP